MRLMTVVKRVMMTVAVIMIIVTMVVIRYICHL